MLRMARWGGREHVDGSAAAASAAFLKKKTQLKEGPKKHEPKEALLLHETAARANTTVTRLHHHDLTTPTTATLSFQNNLKFCNSSGVLSCAVLCQNFRSVVERSGLMSKTSLRKNKKLEKSPGLNEMP